MEQLKQPKDEPKIKVVKLDITPEERGKLTDFSFYNSIKPYTANSSNNNPVKRNNYSIIEDLSEVLENKPKKYSNDLMTNDKMVNIEPTLVKNINLEPQLENTVNMETHVEVEDENMDLDDIELDDIELDDYPLDMQDYVEEKESLKVKPKSASNNSHINVIKLDSQGSSNKEIEEVKLPNLNLKSIDIRDINNELIDIDNNSCNLEDGIDLPNNKYGSIGDILNLDEMVNPVIKPRQVIKFMVKPNISPLQTNLPFRILHGGNLDTNIIDKYLPTNFKLDASEIYEETKKYIDNYNSPTVQHYLKELNNYYEGKLLKKKKKTDFSYNIGEGGEYIKENTTNKERFVITPPVYFDVHKIISYLSKKIDIQTNIIRDIGDDLSKLGNKPSDGSKSNIFDKLNDKFIRERDIFMY